MKPILPRMMLWTDKTSMEEFLREPINKRLYGFYLESRGERWHFGPDDSALLLFNEIYYQLTKVEYEHNLDFNLDDYTKEIEANTGKEHSIVFVYEMFFAFLLLRENNSNVASLFQNYIFYRYNRTWDERTHMALGAIIKGKIKYSVELKPVPCLVKNLNLKIIQWNEITNNFNPSSIKEVLNLWSSKKEKITVLHLIEEAYKKISRKPVKMENVMNLIRVGGNFFSNLYSELGNNDGAATHIEEYVESHTATDADIDEIFDTSPVPQIKESENTNNTNLDSIPEVLKTPEVKQLMQKLSDAGLLDSNWQPLNLSIAEQGYLAGEISSRLRLKSKWKVLGMLWNKNPETLRQGNYQAVKQAKTSSFIDKLKRILH